MAKYFTRRCIGIHIVTVVLVSSFILATWWQYGAATGGNGLSWAYVFEWPAFALYAVYMWWKLIHDQRTAFDRLWTARQHAAADAAGTPLHEIPGWALDKNLSRVVIAASTEAADAAVPVLGKSKAYVPAALGDGEDREPVLSHTELDDVAEVETSHHPESIIDVVATDVRVQVDENLLAYNRYLSELNRRDQPKQWSLRRKHSSAGAHDGIQSSPEPEEHQRGELPVGDRFASGT